LATRLHGRRDLHQGRRGGARVVFDLRPGSYNIQRLMEVLGELHRFPDGDKVTLVWDNLSAHTSRAMRAWIRGQRS
jgi:hypothetical protein